MRSPWQSIRYAKRAQITWFIILGMLLLFIVILAVALLPKTQQFTHEVTSQSPLFPSLTIEDQLDQYVSRCIEVSSLQGLEILRLQGGYIDQTEAETLLVKDAENWQVEGYGLLKKIRKDELGKGNSVRFWVEKEADNVPSPQSIELELNRYVTVETKKCVGNLTSFADQGYTIKKGDITVNTSIGKEVVFTVTFPLEVTKGATKYQRTSFFYRVPINLEKILKIASDLSTTEAMNGFLENYMITMISTYSDRDPAKLPPMYFPEVKFTPSKVTWSKYLVERQLRSMLAGTIPMIRINGTTNPHLVGSDAFEQRLFDAYMVQNLYADELAHIGINFTYRPEWELGFNIAPRNGDRITPDEIVSTQIPILPMIVIQSYDFRYTLSPPILMQVHDDASAWINPTTNTFERGKGFTFPVMMRTAIYGNQPRNEVIRGEEQSSEATYFCNPELFNVKSAVIVVKNALNGSRVENASLSYTCGSAVSRCYLGETNEQGTFIGDLPTCANGDLTILKEGYVSKHQIFSTAGKKRPSLEVAMDPIVRLHLLVQRLDAIEYIKEKYENEIHETFSNPFTHLMENSGFGKEKHDLTTCCRLPFDEELEKGVFSFDGPAPMNLIYPIMKTVDLAAGNYTVHGSVIGDVDLKKGSNPVFGGMYEPYQGTFMMGELYDMPLEITNEQLHKFNTLTLVVPVGLKARELQGAPWTEADDSVYKGKGKLTAEVLYKMTPKFEGLSLKEIKMNVLVDGRQQRDLILSNDECLSCLAVQKIPEELQILGGCLCGVQDYNVGRDVLQASTPITWSDTNEKEMGTTPLNKATP
ncbi:hypothetical protein HZB02_07075 [Candidatus Woesearchaeota archaeon]|nr:hypothetical protein [Candidatus Woesearchaeota archaeon]